MFSSLQQLDPPEEEQLSSGLQSVEVELSKLEEIPWLYHILQPNDEEVRSISQQMWIETNILCSFSIKSSQLSIFLVLTSKRSLHACCL